jgi:hypothetical protein
MENQRHYGNQRFFVNGKFFKKIKFSSPAENDHPLSLCKNHP